MSHPILKELLTSKESKSHTTCKYYTIIFLNQCETLFIPPKSVSHLTQNFVF